MKLLVLDLARDNLIEGFHFYEDWEAGLGALAVGRQCLRFFIG